jgi:hypothetical protein
MADIFIPNLDNDKALNMIEINPMYIESFKENLIIKANNLPMICKPAD